MDGKAGIRSDNESTICIYENSGSSGVKNEGKETWLGPDDFPILVEKEDPLSLLAPVRLGNTYAVVAASKSREETEKMRLDLHLYKGRRDREDHGEPAKSNISISPTSFSCSLLLRHLLLRQPLRWPVEAWKGKNGNCRGRKGGGKGS